MKLSPQQILALTGGILAILTSVGLPAYIWLTILPVVPSSVSQQSFPLTGAQNLLTSAKLIKRAAILQPVPASEPTATKFQDNELGKTDLTKLE